MLSRIITGSLCRRHVSVVRPWRGQSLLTQFKHNFHTFADPEHDKIIRIARKTDKSNQVLNLYRGYAGKEGRRLPPVIYVFLLKRIADVVFFHKTQQVHSHFLEERNKPDSVFDTSNANLLTDVPLPPEAEGKDVHVSESLLHSDARFNALLKDTASTVPMLSVTQTCKLFSSLGHLRVDQEFIVGPVIDQLRLFLKNNQIKKNEELIEILGALSALYIRPKQLIINVCEKLMYNGTNGKPQSGQELYIAIEAVFHLKVHELKFLRYIRSQTIKRFEEFGFDLTFSIGNKLQQMSMPVTELVKLVTEKSPYDVSKLPDPVKNTKPRKNRKEGNNNNKYKKK